MATRRKTVLSQAEKREIYIREGWVGAYNLAKLMAWHDAQEKAKEPDGFMWHKLFRATDFELRQQIQMDMRLRGSAEILDDVAPSGLLDSSQVIPFLSALSGPLKWFADHLDRGSLRAFPIELSRLALVSLKLTHETCVLHLDDEDKTVEFAELSESDLFDAALDAWEDGAPEREQARRWLCGHLWAAIMVLHDQAGVNVDTSVAISDDGNRVLAADYVVVYNHDGKSLQTFRSFQSVAFLMHKIRLGQPHVIRRPAPNRRQTEDQVIQGVLKPGEVKKVVRETLKLRRTQALLQVGKLRILFIDKTQVPSGLQPAVCSTAPAPASRPTQPSPGSEATSSSSRVPPLLQGAPFDPGDD